jgi:DNA repair ATPase RecN
MERFTRAIAFLLLFLAAPLAAQTAADSETLQAILTELRELKHELRDIVLTAGRINDLENRLQFQREKVKKAELRYDETARAVITDEAARKNAADNVRTYTEALERASDDQQKRELTRSISYNQKSIEGFTEMLAQEQGTMEVSRQDLAVEQKKLDSTQEEFDRLVKQFEKMYGNSSH